MQSLTIGASIMSNASTTAIPFMGQRHCPTLTNHFKPVTLPILQVAYPVLPDMSEALHTTVSWQMAGVETIET